MCIGNPVDVFLELVDHSFGTCLLVVEPDIGVLQTFTRFMVINYDFRHGRRRYEFFRFFQDDALDRTSKLLPSGSSISVLCVETQMEHAWPVFLTIGVAD